VTDAHEARPETGETSPRLALGVLVAVSLIQLVTAYRDAGLYSVQTIVGGGFLTAGLWGLAWQQLCKKRRLTPSEVRGTCQRS
jgi:hypothetical protein